MAVRSISLALVNGLPYGAATVLYTVPAARTLILKDWRIVNLSGAPLDLILRVRRGSAAVGVARGIQIPHDGFIESWGREVVLRPGDVLDVNVPTPGSGSANVQVLASGALLEGVAG